MDRIWVKNPSIVVDDERPIGHWFKRDEISVKLVKPRCKAGERVTNILKES